jgi:uncharacterized membrane protein HdeD (DUF308 family)
MLGLVCVAIGATITFRPLTSLDTFVWLLAGAMVVGGGSDLLSAGAAPAPRVAAG